MKGAGKPGPPKDSVSKIKVQHSVADEQTAGGLHTIHLSFASTANLSATQALDLVSSLASKGKISLK